MLVVLSYYYWNEVRLRLKTSLLLWCYFGSISIIFLPNLLFILMFRQLLAYQTLANSLLFVLILYFPTNADILSREKHLNMLDHLVMRATRFKTIYLARIMANATLMIFPIIIGFLTFLTAQFFFISPISFFQSLSDLLIIPPFFFWWFVVNVIVFLIIELKFVDSIIRVILFYFGVISAISCFFLLTELINLPRMLFGIFLGYQLFTDIFLSLIVIIISYVPILFLLSMIIDKRIERSVKELLTKGQMSKGVQISDRYRFYSLFNTLKSKSRTSISKLILPFSFMLYLPVLPFGSDPPHFLESYVLILSIHYVLILLYSLLIVFPRITVEKEFHMEELLLSRITANQYFFDKIIQLLYSIFSPLILPFLLSLIFFTTSLSLFSLISQVLIILVVRALYFIFILIFIWRLFPAKNLLESTIFSLVGLEIFGFLISSFLFPQFYLALQIFGPLISSLTIVYMVTTPSAELYFVISLWMTGVLAIVLFFASLILIKAEVRYN